MNIVEVFAKGTLSAFLAQISSNNVAGLLWTDFKCIYESMETKKPEIFTSLKTLEITALKNETSVSKLKAHSEIGANSNIFTLTNSIYSRNSIHLVMRSITKVLQ